MNMVAVQIGVFFGALFALAKPLGHYMAMVYSGSLAAKSQAVSRVENLTYKWLGIEHKTEMTWRQYAQAILVFSFVCYVATYVVQRTQAWLPLNPAGLSAVSPDSAFNTAVSFVTNTNWQGYAGEATMSYATQMLALTVQNFVSAAVGMAVLVALIRGFTAISANTIGNFWIDMIRGIVFILLPLSIILSLILISQGVVQTFSPYREVALLEPTSDANGKPITTQTLALGPVASQVAIKQLGTNGGGFFNANSAHPFENPTPFSNFCQMLAILLIPAALCFTFGDMIGDARQGKAILFAMLVIFVPLLGVSLLAEHQANPALSKLGVDQNPSLLQSGGNMEGKETRFGIGNSALWSVATTAASNGSVNSMHDSYSPLGGMVAMCLMQLGEIIFGGVGSGLYGMLVFAIIAVFISGLMVGRTPEYLGKKIGAFEMKMASLAILLPCASVLIGTALAVSLAAGRSSILNSGPHGFSEVLYAFSSASNNNGSAFAGLNANTWFYNLTLGLVQLIGRFGVLIPVLAMAGSLAAKRKTPSGKGTLPTHTPLFVLLLIAIIIVVGALSFFPALALGPIIEHLQWTCQ